MGYLTSDTRDFRDYNRGNPDKVRILAEGDSWFAYPRQFFFAGADSNITDHLADRDDLSILNTSSSGDELAQMISGDQKFKLLKNIRHLDLDLLLFSGGGNDILGKYDFGFLLNEKEADHSWRDCLREESISLKMDQIRLAYRELIMRVTDIRPELKIVTHTYDFALPSDVGYRVFDLFPMTKSWLKPYLVEKKITRFEDQRLIIREILLRFKKVLKKLEMEFPERLYVVDTQGLLKREHWRNEIHPTPEGFRIIAAALYEKGIRKALG